LSVLVSCGWVNLPVVREFALDDDAGGAAANQSAGRSDPARRFAVTSLNAPNNTHYADTITVFVRSALGDPLGVAYTGHALDVGSLAQAFEALASWDGPKANGIRIVLQEGDHPVDSHIDMDIAELPFACVSVSRGTTRWLTIEGNARDGQGTPGHPLSRVVADVSSGLQWLDQGCMLRSVSGQGMGTAQPLTVTVRNLGVVGSLDPSAIPAFPRMVGPKGCFLSMGVDSAQTWDFVDVVARDLGYFLSTAPSLGSGLGERVPVVRMSQVHLSQMGDFCVRVAGGTRASMNGVVCEGLDVGRWTTAGVVATDSSALIIGCAADNAPAPQSGQTGLSVGYTFSALEVRNGATVAFGCDDAVQAELSAAYPLLFHAHHFVDSAMLLDDAQFAMSVIPPVSTRPVLPGRSPLILMECLATTGGRYNGNGTAMLVDSVAFSHLWGVDIVGDCYNHVGVTSSTVQLESIALRPTLDDFHGVAVAGGAFVDVREHCADGFESFPGGSVWTLGGNHINLADSISGCSSR
jgi:hypothetical protein